MIISIFTPHGGCPERCHFCDQKTSGGAPVSAKNVSDTIESHLRTQKQGHPVEVAFYGGTFTAMPKSRQIAYLEAAKPYLDSGQVDSVRISTRPDALELDWLNHLKNHYRVGFVELGVQSFDPQVLKALGRSHSVEDAICAVKLLRQARIKMGIHLMLGCPEEGDPLAHDLKMIEGVKKLSPDTVRIHPLLVLAGTALADLWIQGRFIPIDLETALERTARLVVAIEKTGVKVIRLGLQPNELLDAAVLAGPYHPAYGDMVRSRIWRNQLEAELAKLFSEAKQPIEMVQIDVIERSAGSIRGQKNSNLDWLKQRFCLSSIKVAVVKAQSTHDDSNKIRIHHSLRPA